jgi:hypothetical protein
MPLSFLIHSCPLAVLATICTIAILSEKFGDNLAQRVGMSMVAIGSVLQIVAEYHGTPVAAPFTVIVYGASVYALGTLKKALHHISKEGKANEPNG